MGAEAREIETLVRAFLRDEPACAGSTLDLDSALVTSGLLDSIALVRLATLLEQRFGIRIPDRDITFEYFDTIRSIQIYVVRKATG